MPARILIIDDDPSSLALMTYLVEAAGHAALEAADGGAGVRMALEARPDLVICDLQMPVASGFEVVRILHQSPGWPRVPLIAVSAFSMSSDSAAALAAGFAAHISKPIDPETFVARIETFLPPEPTASP